LNRPSPSLAILGELISQDAAMTAKILQLVNSSFFGLARRVTNVPDAVALLGLRTVHALVLMTGLFNHLDLGENNSADELMQHSLSVGAAARLIAGSVSQDRDLMNDAFVAGLLHDIGKLVLAAGFGIRDFASEAESDSSLHECERFGMSHADAGAYLMDLWGLPSTLVEAIAFHHCPEKSMTTGFTPLAAVHVANALVHERENAEAGVHGGTSIQFKYLHKLGLLNRLDAWRGLVRDVANHPVGIAQ
jgi:putative nucleotidyltransferase with HDIG domain